MRHVKSCARPGDKLFDAPDLAALSAVPKLADVVPNLATLSPRTELNTLQKVHHPHAVQFLGAVTQSQPYMIVTEFLPGGSLTDLFKRVHNGAAGSPMKGRPRTVLITPSLCPSALASCPPAPCPGA